MGDKSLFYRPKNPLVTQIGVFFGGPAPSRRDDPAMRFGPHGVEYHETYGRGPTTRLRWEEVRAVAVLPGPVVDRRGLCVFPFQEIPEPDIPPGELFSGTGPGLGIAFRVHFDTPIAVHWHHVRGPSLRKPAQRLPAWTEGRITLTARCPA
ncbi:hypothetical protein [Streptomyces sp. B8F3]|uniref:hypothetical protein n=1 Tax=unclassified Streptomyces TaxID=2593676 RepID=UPI00325F8053